MKLSDIKGERTLDVIAEIIDPIANIAGSDAVKALFKREKLPDGETTFSFAAKRIQRTLPGLLRENKRDIICILASISGKSYAEYAEDLDLVTLTRDLIELTTDEAFTELFMHAQTAGSSGSAQENTVGR